MSSSSLKSIHGDGARGLDAPRCTTGPPAGLPSRGTFLNIFDKLSAMIAIYVENHSSRVGNGDFVVAIYRPWRQKFAEVAIVAVSSPRNPTGALVREELTGRITTFAHFCRHGQ